MNRKHGFHLRVYRGPHWHHAIFVGNGRVIHYTGVTKDKNAAAVQINRLETFASGGRIEVVSYTRALSADEVVRRAHSRVGETGYDFFESNCEHFARWCMTGEHKSAQVETATVGAWGVGGGTAATVGAVSAVVATGELAGLAGGAGVMRGLAAAGSVLGGGAAGGLAVLTVVPTALATVAVRKAFKDDEMLGFAERKSRQVARDTATATGALGVAGSVALVSAVGVPGLSAVGITTGLSAIGGAVGGGMLAGVAVALAGPALLVGLVGFLAYRKSRSDGR